MAENEPLPLLPLRKQHDSYTRVESTEPTKQSVKKKSGFANAWRTGYRQAGEDWRKRWKICGLWVLVIIWFGGLIFALQFLSTLSLLPGGTLSATACQPDGKFSLHPANFQFWAKSGFFEITLGLGDLSFTQAKVIDVIWDIFFGRGGQATVAFISWSVFSNYVTTSMEHMPVTFRTYRTVFLQNQSMLLAIPQMILDFSRRHGLHSKIAMVFMVFSMAFMLIFPTIGSAMTGYKGNVKAYVNSANAQLVRFEDFRYALYKIHDGKRIGLGDDYIVTLPTAKGDPYITYEIQYSDCTYHIDTLDDCYLRYNTSRYVELYNVGGRVFDESSTFMNYSLPAPRLNISVYRVPFPLKGPKGDGINYQDSKRTTWVHSDNLYTVDAVEQNGSCQAMLGYQWGFSFIQLFVMLVLLLIWSFGVYIMWLRSHIILKRRGHRDVAGEYKAVLELADAIHAQLDEHNQENGQTSAGLTESNLRRRIYKDLRGGTISYDTSQSSTGEDGKGDLGWGFRAWVKKEKWWLCALVPAFAAAIACLVSQLFVAVIALSLPLELFIAMCIGSTNKSRGIILLWSFLVLSVLPQIVMILLNTMMSMILTSDYVLVGFDLPFPHAACDLIMKNYILPNKSHQVKVVKEARQPDGNEEGRPSG